MGKLIPNDFIPSSSSSISDNDVNSGMIAILINVWKKINFYKILVHSLTKDFLRLASCCAIERFPFIKKWKTNQEEEEIEYLLYVDPFQSCD